MLNRISFGPTLAEVERVRRLGVVNCIADLTGIDSRELACVAMGSDDIWARKIWVKFFPDIASLTPPLGLIA